MEFEMDGRKSGPAKSVRQVSWGAQADLCGKAVIPEPWRPPLALKIAVVPLHPNKEESSAFFFFHGVGLRVLQPF